jgi:uncharacterized membrane protein
MNTPLPRSAARLLASFAKIRSAAATMLGTTSIGLCLGVTAWQVAHFSKIANVGTNDSIPRAEVLVFIAVSVAAAFAVCAAAHRLRGASRGVPFLASCDRFNRYASILSVAPIFLFLQAQPIGEKSPFFAIFACMAIGGIAVAWVYKTLSLAPPRGEGRRSGSQALPLALVVVFFAAYATALSRFHVMHHRNLGTDAWDLGLYINTMWRSLHGDLLGCSYLFEGTHASRHFDPILVLLAPMLLVHPAAETLLVFQAVWVASGAFPLYLIAKRRLGNPWYGVALAAVYLLHPAVHGPNMYDFHSLVIAGPLILWCVHLLDAGRMRSFLVVAGLLMLCREDMPVLAFLMGVYALINGKPRRYAVATLAASAVYGVVVNAWVMADAFSYAYYFDRVKAPGRSVASSILLSLLSNPIYMLQYMLSEPKLLYMLKLLAPALALPVFAGRKWVLFLCGLAVTAFGSRGCFFMISTQYSVWWLPFMLASVPTAIDNLSRGGLVAFFSVDPDRLRRALAVGAIFGAVAMSSLYGVFWPNPSFRAGYSEFDRSPTPQMLARYETIRKIDAMIPRSASVAATMRVATHFSVRNRAFCIGKKMRAGDVIDYAVLWDGDFKYKNAPELQKKQVQELRRSKEYELILEENGLFLYKRKGAGGG